MKNKIFSFIMSLALIAGLTACNEKWEPGGNGSSDKGTLSTADLALDVANAEKVIETRASINLSDYIITVVNKADGVTVAEWTYATMPGLPMFNVGEYTLTVESSRPAKAAWDQPYFVGSKDFTIVKDQVTKAGTVTCTLKNLKVTVRFADDLVSASAGDLQCEVSTVSSGSEDGYLIFTPAESRSGYFEVVPGNTTMVAVFTGTVNGYKEEIIRTYTGIEQGQHRIITFTMKGADIEIPVENGFIDPVGGLNVDFSVVDENLGGNVNPGDEDVIEGNRPGDEEWPEGPDDPNKPVDPVDPVDPSACIDFKSDYLDLSDGNVNKASVYGTADEGSDLNDPSTPKPAVVTILSEHGIANLEVTINSPGLNADELEQIGLPQSFDLAHPGSAEVEEALGTLGFPIKNEVIGKTSVKFDITTFVPLLPAFEGPHEFLIKVTDQSGHTRTLVLNFVNE